MPNRIIRDGWNDSEKIDALAPDEECFFLRLCLRVDDYGRFTANPRLLKAALYPLKDDVRDADISRKLAAAEQAGLVRCYEVDSKRFLEVVAFNQQVRSKSKCPDPPWLGKCKAAAEHVQSNRAAVAHLGGGGGGVEGGGETGGSSGAREGCPTEIEPPRGWPRNETQAKDAAPTIGAPVEFILKAWGKAAQRGWRDGNDVPIRSTFPHFIGQEWRYERERIEKGKSHASSQRTGRPSDERNRFIAGSGGGKAERVLAERKAKIGTPVEQMAKKMAGS